ncbi:MAG: hypothetical protein N2316_13995, partial [Spirochaetes bacterium]|nr:hypothetical protein [Spirochaetota bacterium]
KRQDLAQPPKEFNKLLDTRSESGEIEILVYADEDASGRMLESMIIDAVNDVADIMKLLRASSKGKDINDANIIDTTRELAGAVNDLFKEVRNDKIAFDEFSHKVSEKASAAESLALLQGMSSLPRYKSELQKLTESFFSRMGEMRDLSKTARALAVGKEGARANFIEKSQVRDEKQKEFAALSKALEDAQHRYREATNAYLGAMNETAKRYKEFKEKEHEYEKAYAVWEYAHTPYLLDTIAKDAQSGKGELPTGEKQVLSKLAPADAHERYARVKAEYEKADANYRSRKEAMEKQKRVEDLLQDERYKALRDEFEREAKSYARFDRAATLLAEQTAMLSAEVEMLRKEYVRAKDMDFEKMVKEKDEKGNDIDKVVPLTNEEKIKRDAILGRMIAEIDRMGIKNFIMHVLVREFVLRSGVEFVKANEKAFTRSRPPYLVVWYLPPIDENNGNGGYIGGKAGKEEIEHAYDEFKRQYPQLYDDIEYLRSHNIGYGSLIEKVAREYYDWKHWHYKYLDAKERCNDWEPWWCNNARHRREQASIHQNNFITFYNKLSEYLISVKKARNKLDEKEKLLYSYERVRSAKEFREKTFAAHAIIDNRHYLALTDDDRNRIFDDADNRATIGASDVNITVLRKKSMRRDIDGNVLK